MQRGAEANCIVTHPVRAGTGRERPTVVHLVHRDDTFQLSTLAEVDLDKHRYVLGAVGFDPQAESGLRLSNGGRLLQLADLALRPQLLCGCPLTRRNLPD